LVACLCLSGPAGRLIRPSEAFREYRHKMPSTDPAVEARRPHIEDLFATLKKAEIKRHDLFLAWDFTVASERSLSERVLFMRNDAFAQLGDTNLADLQV